MILAALEHQLSHGGIHLQCEIHQLAVDQSCRHEGGDNPKNAVFPIRYIEPRRCCIRRQRVEKYALGESRRRRIADYRAKGIQRKIGETSGTPYGTIWCKGVEAPWVGVMDIEKRRLGFREIPKVVAPSLPVRPDTCRQSE